MDGSSLTGVAISDVENGFILTANIGRFVIWIQYTVAEERDPVSYFMQLLRIIISFFNF